MLCAGSCQSGAQGRWQQRPAARQSFFLRIVFIPPPEKKICFLSMPNQLFIPWIKLDTPERTSCSLKTIVVFESPLYFLDQFVLSIKKLCIVVLCSAPPPFITLFWAGGCELELQFLCIYTHMRDMMCLKGVSSEKTMRKRREGGGTWLRLVNLSCWRILSFLKRKHAWCGFLFHVQWNTCFLTTEGGSEKKRSISLKKW